jgi:hypothetical protein
MVTGVDYGKWGRHSWKDGCETIKITRASATLGHERVLVQWTAVSRQIFSNLFLRSFPKGCNQFIAFLVIPARFKNTRRLSYKNLSTLPTGKGTNTRWTPTVFLTKRRGPATVHNVLRLDNTSPLHERATKQQPTASAPLHINYTAQFTGGNISKLFDDNFRLKWVQVEHLDELIKKSLMLMDPEHVLWKINSRVRVLYV